MRKSYNHEVILIFFLQIVLRNSLDPDFGLDPDSINNKYGSETLPLMVKNQFSLAFLTTHTKLVFEEAVSRYLLAFLGLD